MVANEINGEWDVTLESWDAHFPLWNVDYVSPKVDK